MCFPHINKLSTIHKPLGYPSSCFYPFFLASPISWILYIHLSSSDRNLENGATLVGKEKGILAKINFSFFAYYRKSRVHFNSENIYLAHTI